MMDRCQDSIPLTPSPPLGPGLYNTRVTETYELSAIIGRDTYSVLYCYCIIICEVCMFTSTGCEVSANLHLL